MVAQGHQNGAELSWGTGPSRRPQVRSSSVSAPLSIGLNLTYLIEDSGGSGTYARELIRAMQAVEPDTRITGFVSRAVPERIMAADWADPVDWVQFPFHVGSGRVTTKAATIAAQWAALPMLARRHRLDLIHGLANIVPPVSRVPTVVTVLDVIWIHHPRAMERGATLAMKLVAPFSARRADRVIAISNAARDDLVKTLRLDAERVDVTYLGVRLSDTVEPTPSAELRRRLSLGSGPVILCVAQKREHKNLSTLVRALPRVPDPEAVLVLPGAPTPYESELRELAQELGVGDRVVLPPWVSEPDLEGLYGLASCFVLPSLIEGFGLPILEAMRRRLPVACSNAASLPEVAGDAALLFNPLDADEMANAVTRLIEDRGLAGQLTERGLERCRRFTWESTARATLATYRRTLATSRS